jgi:hypothetical protein
MTSILARFQFSRLLHAEAPEILVHAALGDIEGARHHRLVYA